MIIGSPSKVMIELILTDNDKFYCFIRVKGVYKRAYLTTSIKTLNQKINALIRRNEEEDR